jgi:hypothetical protein
VASVVFVWYASLESGRVKAVGSKAAGSDFQISICPGIPAPGKLKFESLTLLSLLSRLS